MPGGRAFRPLRWVPRRPALRAFLPPPRRAAPRRRAPTDPGPTSPSWPSWPEIPAELAQGERRQCLAIGAIARIAGRAGQPRAPAAAPARARGLGLVRVRPSGPVVAARKYSRRASRMYSGRREAARAQLHCQAGHLHLISISADFP